MLIKIHKNIIKFKLVYFLYVIILNFFFCTAIITIQPKLHISNKDSEINNKLDIINILAVLEKNSENVNKLVVNEYQGFQKNQYSKYFCDSFENLFPKVKLKLISSYETQNYISNYEIVYNSSVLRSPPSISMLN